MESSFHTLLTSIERLYANMYLIGPLDVAVSRYTLRLEIYVTTFVKCEKLIFSLNRRNVTYYTIPALEASYDKPSNNSYLMSGDWISYFLFF